MAKDKESNFDAVTVIGVIVALGLLFGGQYWMNKNQKEAAAEWRRTHPEQPVTQTQTPPTLTNGAPDNGSPKTGAEKGPDQPKGDKGDNPPPVPVVEAEVEPADPGDITVTGEHLKVVFSARGATITQASLPDEFIDPALKDRYSDSGAKGKDLEILTEIETGKRAFGLPHFEIGPPQAEREKERLVLEGPAGAHRSLDNRIWKLADKSLEGDEPRIVYTATVDKFTITKTFTVSKSGRTVRATIAIENGSAQPVSYAYTLYGPMGVLMDNPPSALRTSSAYGGMVKAELGGRENASSEDVDIKQVDTAAAASGQDDKRSISNPQNLWAAVKNRFFVLALVSVKPDQVIRLRCVQVKYLGTQTTDARLTEANIGVEAMRTPTTLEAGKTSVIDDYALFAGPDDQKTLEAAEAKLSPPKPVGLGQIAVYCDYFGWTWPRVDWIARKLMLLFDLLKRMFGSFGVAVMLLTLAIKAALHPLQRKSMISMNKMQKIQPEIKKIQEKYKNQTSLEARQKMGMEQQDLMKKAGANPASGCLPMFIQIPIMTALYGIFIHAFEMRGAEFLWIRDLSRQDQLLTFGFFPYELNLLPIIYMGVTIVQQKINPPPKSDDPQQEVNRKMMTYMPIVMSVLFYRVPAGLVLYFATSAICGAFETWYIKKYLIKDDAAAGAAGKVAAATPVPAR